MRSLFVSLQEYKKQEYDHGRYFTGWIIPLFKDGGGHIVDTMIYENGLSVFTSIALFAWLISLISFLTGIICCWRYRHHLDLMRDLFWVFLLFLPTSISVLPTAKTLHLLSLISLVNAVAISVLLLYCFRLSKGGGSL